MIIICYLVQFSLNYSSIFVLPLMTYELIDLAPSLWFGHHYYHTWSFSQLSESLLSSQSLLIMWAARIVSCTCRSANLIS